jgi:RND family efflux transporter MFP subunit
MITPNAARAVLFTAGLALACAGCGQAAPDTNPLLPVRVETAGPAAGGAPGLRYSAAIVPHHAMPVAFKAAGYVDSIMQVSDGSGRQRLLQEGDRVRRGQTLARIRTDDYRVKVDQASSQQAEAEAALTQARQAFERANALYEKKSLTRPDFEAAQAAYDMVRAKVDGARALVSEASNAVADTTLQSPLDGIVISRMIETGALVGPGTPGFVVADISSVKIRFGAPDFVVRRLERGQVQTVTTDAYPNERFEGRVTSLAPTADPGSLVFDVELTVPNADGRLKPGMVASIEVGDDDERPQVTLPLSAIIRSTAQADGYAVFIIEERDGGTHARRRDVTLGRMVSNGVAVTGGLRAGEQVIVTGARMVADGERVEVLR